MCDYFGHNVATCISSSVITNGVSSTVLIGLSKTNKSYRNWLDLPLLIRVCYTVQK